MPAFPTAARGARDPGCRYLTVLPLVLWRGELQLGRQLTVLMSTCLYAGNAMKDALCAPRPPSPPVRRTGDAKQAANAKEYGLPSSHVLSSFCMIVYPLCFYAWETGELRGAALVGWASLATAAIALIAFARLHLGMHSLIDVQAGFLGGIVLLVYWLTLDQTVDAWMLHGTHVVPIQTLMTAALLAFYPVPEDPTPSFEFCQRYHGTTWGIVVGVRHGHAVMARAGRGTGWRLAARFVVGLSATLALKEATAPAIRTACRSVLGPAPGEGGDGGAAGGDGGGRRTRRGRAAAAGARAGAEKGFVLRRGQFIQGLGAPTWSGIYLNPVIAARALNYALVGFGVTYVSFHLFVLLGI